MLFLLFFICLYRPCSRIQIQTHRHRSGSSAPSGAPSSPFLRYFLQVSSQAVPVVPDYCYAKVFLLFPVLLRVHALSLPDAFLLLLKPYLHAPVCAAVPLLHLPANHVCVFSEQVHRTLLRLLPHLHHNHIHMHPSA